MKVGDLVRRVDLPGHTPHWLRSDVGVIVEELEPDAARLPTESYDESLFKVFWGEKYGTFVSTESKLELVSDCHRNMPCDLRGNEL